VVAPPSLAEGEKKGLRVAANLKADSLKTLRAMPAGDLQKATGQGLSFGTATGRCGGWLGAS
jgi:hypothetical protein